MIFPQFIQENVRIEPRDFEVLTILDLGANIGIESLRFAVFHPQARIVAVEADQDNYDILRKNVASFKQVRALHAAVWGAKVRLQVKQNPSSPVASVVSTADEGSLQGLTIHELIEQLGVREIDILKVDIEGAEDSVFGVSIADWIGRVRIIIWELNDHEAPFALTRLVSAMRLAGVAFNFHIRGEKLVGIRSDISVRIHYACGLFL
ncbi:MAG: FkbM family methyltransferase [Lacunisphaera sp.]|nr:FkbM family methyltransferase [Lacunisphaera sp.]